MQRIVINTVFNQSLIISSMPRPTIETDNKDIDQLHILLFIIA